LPFFHSFESLLHHTSFHVDIYFTRRETFLSTYPNGHEEIKHRELHSDNDDTIFPGVIVTRGD
jgi:hypothetical protein